MPKYKAYVVTVGRKIGVFTKWLDVVPLVRGVSNPAFQGFPDWGSANDAFEEAYARGETKIVRDGPPKSERPKQEPRRSGGTRSTGTRSSTTLSSAGRAARDAIIAETLEAARRESRHNSTSGVRDNAQGPSTRSMTRAQAQAMQQVPPRQSAPRTQPVLPSGMPQGGRNSKSTSSNPSTSSSPPTCVTQRETSQSPLYARSPRYAQSLSYASDTSPAIQSDVHMASPATGSSALASGDCRTDVSSPSTNTTKYFPADFATRPRDAYTKMRERDAAKLLVRSPATTVSEYATPSGSAQTRQSDLSPLTSGNPMPPPATQSTVVQSPVTPVSSGTKTRRRKVGKDYSDASIQVDCPIRKRVYTAAQVQASDERQFAAAEVQTSPALWGRTMPPHTSASSTGGVSDGGQLEGECGCKHPAHVCRHCGLPARVMQSVANRIATPTLASPDVSVAPSVARSSAASPAPHSSVSTPAKRSAVAPPAAHSFGSSPAARSSMSSLASHSVVASPMSRASVSSPTKHSSVASPTSRLSITSTTCFSSPIAYTELASSPPSSSASTSPASFHSAPSSSARSSLGGYTPLLGSSERRSASIVSAASLQEGLDALVRSTPARSGGASAVTHDISFDPRSPIQRGTLIAAGSGFNAFVRPSPTLAPLDSLLFS